MTSLEILGNLQAYAQIAALLLTHENAHLKASVSSSYDFVTLSLKNPKDQLYCQFKFQVSGATAKLTESHCPDSVRVPEPPKWDPKLAGRFSTEVASYLKAADEIAAVAVNRASGDSYRPGFYSNVTLTDEAITLEQINHMNAKSTDHKENYSLRNLEFQIPLGTKEVKAGFSDHMLGRMRVKFRDSSSKNNQVIGNDILEKLLKVKKGFESGIK